MSFTSNDLTIIKVPEFEPQLMSLTSFLERYDSLWQRVYDSTSLNGSLWVFVSNIYIQGELVPLAWELAQRIRTVSIFKLKNILVVYKEKPIVQEPLVQSYYNILFLVKSLRYYHFDKDAIREPHIFKDIEWGHRKVGASGYNERERVRYSPKGRDPGNVFYKTERTPEGKILRIDEYSDEELYEKIIKMSTKKDSSIASNISNSSFIEAVHNLDRKFNKIEA